MNTIEPIQFRWNGDGINTDENYNRRLPERAWDETADFIFHQAAIQLCDEISPYTLQEKYAEIVESEIEPLKDVLPLPERRIQMGSVSSGRRNEVYYVRGETVIVPSKTEQGVVRLVSNNKGSARDLRDKLATELEDLGEQFHGAGITGVEVLTGEDFAKRNISHPNAEISIKQGEAGSFESEIIDELKPLSEAFASNIEIDFQNYSPCPEFDIIYPQSAGNQIQIEVKDYSGSDNNPGEKEAIQRPLRKASLLGIGRTFTVLKGVDEGVMANLKNHSELRSRIQIVEKHEMSEVLQPMLERSLVSGPPGGLFRK